MASRSPEEKFKANMTRLVNRFEIMISAAREMDYQVISVEVVSLVKGVLSAISDEDLIQKFVNFIIPEKSLCVPSTLVKIKDRDDTLIRNDLVNILKDTPLKNTNIFGEVYKYRMDEDMESESSKRFRKDIEYLWKGLTAMVDNCYDYDENLRFKEFWVE